MGPMRTVLGNGRWHFAHGPIELVIGADGDAVAVQAAHERAWLRFASVLTELVAELPLLRQPVRAGDNPLRGTVARRMWQACAVMPTDFITPMAAVAGAVAEEIVAACRVDGITRAWVNNGGDIALHLPPGSEVAAGVVADISRSSTSLDARLTIAHADPVRGIATSGWRGRSFSLGVADSVTVLAATAALADAAATLVANAVNVDDARIRRAPACELKDDSDLGERLVTVDVPPLPPALVHEALQRGQVFAYELQRRGLIHDVALFCQGRGATLRKTTPMPLAA
jgi:uncharacterized protein